VDTPVLRLTEGGVDDRLRGPLLIELPDTVIVVRPGQSARFGELGSLVIDL
jgi:N-methylhydantoinase A/oxoprolinase/acetone carboxylase beta subunit